MYQDSMGSGPHGRTSPLRIDPSTMLGLIVAAALVVLAGLHFAFKGAVSVSR